MSGYGFPLQLFLVAMLLVGCAALLVIRNQGESAGRNRVGWAIFPVQQRSGAVLAALVLWLAANVAEPVGAIAAVKRAKGIRSICQTYG